MSRNGLGCEYAVYKDTDEEPPESEIDIFLSDNRFYMSRVQCKVVYEIHMDNCQDKFAKTIDYRRCGLQFGKLTVEQREQLEFFLENHVVMSS